MPTRATPVANDLVEYCTTVLQPLFDEKQAVVWYDHEGVLEEPLRAAAGRRGWQLVPEPGARNPLAARAAIEEQIQVDGCQWRAERKWLVYVTAARRQPSWYEDLELAGRKVERTLAQLIAERHRLPGAKVVALINARAAKRLVAQWDHLFPHGTWVFDLEILGTALLSLAFGESTPLTPANAVLRFLRDPTSLAASLREAGLTASFVQIIRAQLGFGRLPETDEVKPALLVRAMLASELIHRGACDSSHALNNYLPQKNHIPAWAALAESAVKDADGRKAFWELATAVEAEVHLVQHATNLRALAKVTSVPSVDDRLLDEAIARCQAAPAGSPAVWTEMGEWADERLKVEQRGAAIARDWQVVASAARLLLGCQAAEKDLDGLPAPIMPDLLIRRYSDHDSGWWRLDDLHRGLELRFPNCRAGVVEHLGRPAVAALWKWCRRLATEFAEAFERAGSYTPASREVLPHGRFWTELVETGDLGQTAVLLVDALRMDLAETLIARLQQPGRQVTSRLALAALPSKTPVGMAALLPPGCSPLVVLARNGKLRSEIDGLDVSSPDGRTEHLQKHVPNVETAQLKTISEVQLKQWAADRRPAVLMTRDIDSSGEIAAEVSPGLFEEMIEDLVRSVTVLHRAGYRRVVIGTDHGFLLVPAETSLEEVTGPGKGPDTTFSTRYAVGLLPGDESSLSFTPTALGRGGSGFVVLPKGLRAFPTSGPRHKFVHGGLSPQECLLRFITSAVAGPPPVPVQVRLSRPANIATLILFLDVEVTQPAGPTQARRVRVEARSGDRSAGRSAAETYRPQADLGPGEVYPRLKLKLDEAPALIDLVLLDDDSGDELDRQSGVASVMRRTDDDDLL